MARGPLKQLRSTGWGAVLVVAAWAGGAIAQDATLDPAAAPENPTDAAAAPGASTDVKPVKREGRIGSVGASQGRGFGLTEDGRSRLHLSLDAGTGFDTNPYAVPLEDSVFAGDIVFRVRPGAQINYDGSLVAFDADAYIDYGFLPGVLDARTQNWLLYQSLLNADLQLNRGGMFTFAVGDSVSWNSDPAQVLIGDLYNRVNNQFRAGVGFKPGGGTLALKLAYAFDFTHWIDVTPNPAGPGPIANGVFDQMVHTASLRADYRFLPKTGAFGSVSAGWSVFPFTTLQPQSFPINITLGVMGQITPKLTGLASLGYSNPLVLDDEPSGTYGIQTGTFIGIMGQAELRWAITQTTRLGGGFARTVNPAPLYQYLVNNRFYLGFDQLIGDKLSLGLNLGYSVLQFGIEQAITGTGFLTTQPNGDRLDGHLDARVAVTYNVFDWLGFGVNNISDWRVTNAESGGSGTEQVNLGFFRNQTLLMASVRY